MSQAVIKPIYVHIFLLTGSFGLLYFETITKLVSDWSNDPNFSHGYFVPLISAFMVWQKRQDIIAKPTKPGNLGMLVLLLGMLLFVIGNIGAERFTRSVSMIVTIGGLSWFVFGAKKTSRVIVPIIYLLFMIPIPTILWNKIAFPMQLLASRLAEGFVQAIGVPILREGNVLHLATTTLEVVDACSGLRSLTSLLALSAAFAYLVSIGDLSRWIIFLSAIPISVALNVLRLTITALLAQLVSPNFAQGFLHEISGIMVFVIAFILVFVLFSLLSKLEDKYSHKR